MKTVEQATKEYNSQFSHDSEQWIAEDAFKKGIEFAQRWISVDDELPAETGWMNTPYLIKTKYEFNMAGYTKKCFHKYGGLCFKSGVVTHWRHIEHP